MKHVANSVLTGEDIAKYRINIQKQPASMDNIIYYKKEHFSDAQIKGNHERYIYNTFLRKGENNPNKGSDKYDYSTNNILNLVLGSINTIAPNNPAIAPEAPIKGILGSIKNDCKV